MLTSQPPPLEQNEDDCKADNGEQPQTKLSPNNNDLDTTLTQAEAITTTTVNVPTIEYQNTAIAQQHRNSGSRDSNGGKAVAESYKRSSKESAHNNDTGGPSSGDGGSRDGDNEETDVIGDLVGHFGKWQFLMTILLSLFQVPNTFHISSSVYQVG